MMRGAEQTIIVVMNEQHHVHFIWRHWWFFLFNM